MPNACLTFPWLRASLIVLPHAQVIGARLRNVLSLGLIGRTLTAAARQRYLLDAMWTFRLRYGFRKKGAERPHITRPIPGRQ
ncbi:hypothetical protein O999_23660 [Pseudomonas putida LF54]|nr:hypothetical protein O999_23660 [Pseudomonas putida LF54]